ncbi:MAG TPA: hypothetical protein DDW74_01785 [Porphyromonadaceae bacterium]|nr:hypothetical protein [Porphyromonadaceae bacterium]HBG79437.1 hypothetical protein [Porphyromonadaceae bacterium]
MGRLHGYELAAHFLELAMRSNECILRGIIVRIFEKQFVAREGTCKKEVVFIFEGHGKIVFLHDGSQKLFGIFSFVRFAIITQQSYAGYFIFRYFIYI